MKIWTYRRSGASGRHYSFLGQMVPHKGMHTDDYVYSSHEVKKIKYIYTRVISKSQPITLSIGTTVILNGTWVALHAWSSRVGKREFWYFNLFSLLWHVMLLAVLQNSFEFWGIKSLKELVLRREDKVFWHMGEGIDVIDKNQNIRKLTVFEVFYWYVECTDVYMSKNIACGVCRYVLLKNSWNTSNSLHW